MTYTLSLICCVILTLSYTECSNILSIFNTPSKSHSILGIKLAEGLVKRGHHVTIASPYHIDPMENLTTIHLKGILDYRENMNKEHFNPTSNASRWTKTLEIMYFFQTINTLFWEDPAIQKIIREKPKYDAVVMVNFFNDATMGLAHHLGVPNIGFSTLGANAMINSYVANPNMPYAVNVFMSKPTDSFLGRLVTVSLNVFMDLLTDFVLDPLQEGLMRKYIPEVPSLNELKKNVSLVLVNSHFSIEPPRPYVPNMIQIGGFHVQDTKELPKDIKSYLDSATQGAILFSMGSNMLIASIEEEKLRVIFSALGEMAPMKVLFKSELEHENSPTNIKVSKWLPQADILAHPNIRVFVSHGGLGGNTEAVYHGVPILGIPIFGDQKMNLAEAQKAGYAEVVLYENIAEEFKNKLKHVTENEKYRNNAKKRSALMKEQPVKPMDNAAFWIEHIIKYGGGSHLKNAGMDLTWFQLYMVDIYVFYTTVLLLSFVINYYVIKFSVRLVKRLYLKMSSKVKTS